MIRFRRVKKRLLLLLYFTLAAAAAVFSVFLYRYLSERTKLRNTEEKEERAAAEYLGSVGFLRDGTEGESSREMPDEAEQTAEIILENTSKDTAYDPQTAVHEEENSKPAEEEYSLAAVLQESPKKPLKDLLSEHFGSAFRDSGDNYRRGGQVTTDADAEGPVSCILFVPAAGILKPVHQGTEEEIAHDLDLWLTVAARPDYRLSETHYVIYGHNHTEQNLSFNRLREVSPGDRFFLIAAEELYTYRVNRVFPEWREKVTASITDNFGLPGDLCYIITCGRNEYRYRDLVVEGRLVQNEISADSAETELNDENEGREENRETKTAPVPVFEIRKEEQGFRIREQSASKNRASEIGLFTEDGLLLRDSEGVPVVWKDEGEGKLLTDLPDGRYLVGILSGDSGESPEPQVLEFANGAASVASLEKERNREYFFFVSAGIAALLILSFAFCFRLRKRKEVRAGSGK